MQPKPTVGLRTSTAHKQALIVGLALVAITAYTLENPESGASTTRGTLTLMAVFFAGIVASVAGFAFSAIAGALIVHLYSDPVEMVRILLVCSVTIQAYCTLMLFKHIRWRELAPYLAGGLLTAPLGVAILIQLSSSAYALTLGAFLVCYGLYSLLKPLKIVAHKQPLLDAFVGALGGITGGIAAFPGAFATIWCSARGLSKESQRALCQPYIFFMQIGTLACLEYTRRTEVTAVPGLLVFIPISLLAASIGFDVFQRLTAPQFKIVVLNVLIASGLVLVFKSW